MELKTVDTISLESLVIRSSGKFIEANTIKTSLSEIKEKHLIPVFVRDNEPLISQGEFIEATQYVAESIFRNEKIAQPVVRVSHPIKGRISEAKRKPADQLEENEKTIFYERMAFMMEIPTIQSAIGGNSLSLTIGGVKAYNQDNLYAKRGAEQNFKLFIGFKNTVCTNLCIWSNGSVESIKARSITELVEQAYNLFVSYEAEKHLKSLEMLPNQFLSEKQFALMIGRSRMYQYLPPEIKKTIPLFKLTDAQINAVAAGYFRDENFNGGGEIDLWKLYNLFTGANKSSYIDTFLDKGINCFDFVNNISHALDNKGSSWFIN